jgi:transcriptional regulator with XRE-family HTH domain
VDINERIAATLARLRHENGWSIDHLADRSGVSRAMISKIERAESSPTASVLNKLSVGFGIPLPALFGPSNYNEAMLIARNPIASRRRQQEWHDPATGYRRRALTPPAAAQSLNLSEAQLPPGARITVDHPPAAKVLHRQIWILEGGLELRSGENVYQLATGDCIAMRLDGPLALHNPGRSTVRYLLATA